MARVALSPDVPATADTLIVGLAGSDGEHRLVGLRAPAEEAHAADWGQSVLTAAQLVGATSKPSQVRFLPGPGGRLAIVGLGAAETDLEQLRKAAANAVRASVGPDTPQAQHIALSLGATSPAGVQAVVEGALVGAYRFAPISRATPPEDAVQFSVVVPAGADTADLERAIAIGEATARAVVRTADWVNQPPNLFDPAAFAAQAEALAKPDGLTVEVIDEGGLAAQGFGGLLAVGSGSARPPRLVQVTWAPPAAQGFIALVGKGITFDSGGINIKPLSSMATMKSDMAGAAACLSAVAAAAELRLPVRVTAWLALAENLPSGSACRPSDVLTMYGGTTVESFNTDAEGRLVLADALARAAEDTPDLIVDVATLTGACIVALGQRTMGVMASDTAAAGRVLAAAEDAGEAAWRLPITDEAEAALSSKVADLKSGGPREGGALIAAAFLRRFSGGRPWAHIDIAGPAFHTGDPHDLIPVGGTGAGVRTLIALLRAAC
jgi:leucyl aminopeptidase